MILTQVLTDNQLANWVLSICLIVIGFLLVRMLNRIEKTLIDHNTRITKTELDIAVSKEIYKIFREQSKDQ